MAGQSHLDPSPFFLDGGATGALLIHGFTGSPPEMRLVGDYLHERGFTISAPLLPGHGTCVEDMNLCRWRDWTDHAEGALRDLQDRCERVFVGGLSMGTLLSVYLAAYHPEVSGAVLYAPAVKVESRLIYLTPVLKHVLPVWSKSGKSDEGEPEEQLHYWSYEAYPVRAAHEVLKLVYRVRRLLPQVTCPALVFHAAHDKYVRAEGAQYTYDRIGSADKELVRLAHSGHALTVDVEWETVAERTYAFLRRVSAAR